ncbi:MAG: putative toxin-antitoxin system toxin component, PIN family [Desulfitobacteriaceae bacterium]|nr:putative toxin-antitoxin system toxin component, PIN family [Desulfitobacteriaceae bacterium]MDI6878195.1 putative toxin-antitoxin system toxin component, PIN family [Desulfitobacteriaceae bacterium]MDI6913492.1 putative toxin-antitoxin system toxin component, PIN family [Desulfitobacteriaceae bacterium]
MKRTIKAVIDTQIFIKSWFANKYGYCDQILDLIDQGTIRPVFSQDTIGELMLITKNFAYHVIEDKENRLEILQNLARMFLDAISVNTQDTIGPKLKDETDEMFLKAAIKGEADFLISDDFRSGLHQIDLEGIRIVSSEEFIAIYQEMCESKQARILAI